MRKKTIMLLLVWIFLATFTLTGCITFPQRVRVPDVIGYDIEDGCLEIESKNLVPYPIAGIEAPETNLEETIYLQNPAASKRVPKGSGVELNYYTTIPPPPPEPRLIAILGTCLDSCQYMWKEIGGEHFESLSFYGNRYGWPGHDLVEELGMKMFINIRAENWRFSVEEQEELSRLRNYVKSTLTQAKITGSIEALAAPSFEVNLGRYKELILQAMPNEDEIQRCVNEWKGRPGCGGFWTDTLGHEPDISGALIEERQAFYNTIRECDPDGIQERPVMEMMNMTEWDDQAENWPYPGWKGAFREDTNDLVLVDCYPGSNAVEIERNIRWAWEKFVKKYCKENQVIIQFQAFNYEPGQIWTQYNLWKELFASDEWDNPYKSPMGLCFYKDETIRQSPEMQQEIKEVIADAMR